MKQFGFGGTDLVRCLQKFAAVHSSVHNHFNQERHFYSRDNFKFNRTAALTECLSAATAMPLVNTTTGVGMTAVVAECDQH